MIFVDIRIVKEVIAHHPTGKKSQMAEKIVAAISETGGIPKGDVWLVFE